MHEPSCFCHAQTLSYVVKSDQVMRALVAAAPENKQQRGLFAALLATNGITLGNLGRLDTALKNLNEARASFELLEKSNSSSQETDSYSGLGDLELRNVRKPGELSAKRRESWMQALAWYVKSLEAWHRVEHPLPMAPSGFDAGDPTRLRRTCSCATPLWLGPHPQPTSDRASAQTTKRCQAKGCWFNDSLFLDQFDFVPYSDVRRVL